MSIPAGQQILTLVNEVKILFRYSIYLVPLCIAIVLFGIFGFNGYYGQDSHEYLRLATAFKGSGFQQDALTDFHWPLVYPLAGILISFLGIPLKWSLVVVSFLAACGTLWILKKLIEQLYKTDATIWLLLAACSQVYFIRGGILAMSDMLCCFFVLLSYYHYFRYREHGHWRFMVFLTGAATAAFFTRYAAVPLLIPPLLAGFTLVFRSRRVALKIAAVLFLSAAVELILWSSDRFFAVGIDIWKQWSWENVFALQAEEESGVLLRTVPNGLYIFGNFFHIGFLAIGTLLLPFYRQVLREKVVWFGSLLYLALLVGLSTQNYRFLMVLHPLVLLLLFPAFRGLSDWLKGKRLFTIFVLGVLVFNAAFFVYSFRKTYAVFATERKVAQAILELTEDVPIYSFYVDQSFPSYGIQNEVRNLYLSRYETFESGALLVYNPKEFTEQWGNTNVGLNWKKLNEEYLLDTLQRIDGNWRIYRIH
ncbi:MAG: hypothetical protein A3D92_09100 [Bacteroidetes bacterium RIFCSPHIGHO2_02_FULL_44_7]|nr:MAG: hypothetical protein A3D92_09100 [Bacteroidetes bacterium RIFCSPHIGHO2_02_FULL_44_7]